MSFGGSTIALWNDELELMRPVIEKAGYRFLTDDPQFRGRKAGAGLGGVDCRR